MHGERVAGRYLLTERLGAGGMGEVWRAVDERLGRAVAVKLVPLPAAGETGPERRFRREARAGGALAGAHVATVHDVGDVVLAGGRFGFLVMEFVDGRSLAAVAESGPVAVADAVRWGAQLCRGLQSVHEAGLVHRDVKPTNVMLTASGRIVLLDFGIARRAGAVREGSVLTRPGVAIGTPAYMAPEQARGAAGLDARADLYAVGCVLYELLAGRRPFNGDGWAVLRRHQEEAPAGLSTVRPEVPAGLARLVDALLAKDPGDRPAGAAAVARRLEAIAAGIPVQTDAGAVTAGPRAPAPTRIAAGVAGSGLRTRTGFPALRGGAVAGVLAGTAAAVPGGWPTGWAAGCGLAVCLAFAVLFGGTESGAAIPDGNAAEGAVALVAFAAALLAVVVVLADGPGRWWAAVVAGLAGPPVLIGCAAVVRSAVETWVGLPRPGVDIAVGAGLVGAAGWGAALALGTNLPSAVVAAGAAAVWWGGAAAAGRLLPRPRRER